MNNQEFDAREVEALAKWFREGPLKLFNADSEDVARFMLAREARLVAMLERSRSVFEYWEGARNLGIGGERGIIWEIGQCLTAHRAATAPSEPTLEQAVDALLADAQCTGQPTLKCVDADKLAALRAARERATGGRK